MNRKLTDLNQLKAFDHIETARLILHRPSESDSEEIFERYANDPRVTRYVGFKTHDNLEDTKEFLLYSDTQWRQWPAGPLLIRRRKDNVLIGSTGLSFETSYRAMTGYVIARDSWNMGYATEVLLEVIEIGRLAGVRRIYALCHTEHRASWRVLDKCRFSREGILRSYTIFPNLSPNELQDVYCYSLIL